MRLRRRQLFHLAANAAAFSAVSRIAWAQGYPARPVRLLVGFPAGGTTNLVARQVGDWLSQRLGQPFIVENRAGAGGNIAAAAVAKEPPDGYRLVTVSLSNVINSIFAPQSDFDLSRDLAMVAGLNKSPLVLVVHRDVPVKSVPEFISYAKANQGKVSMASFGAGTVSHVAGALFKLAADLDLVHVSYRGSGPLLTDLLGGHVDAAFDNLPACVQHIKDGNLRALAVTTATPSEALPQIPSLGEFFPGYEVSPFIGVAAPRGTPTEIVIRLNREINAGLADPKIKGPLAEQGGAPLLLSPAELAKLFENERKKWAQRIRDANIKPE